MYSLGNKNQLHSSSPSHSKHFNERTDVRAYLRLHGEFQLGLKFRYAHRAEISLRLQCSVQPWRKTQISMRKFTEVQKHYSAPFSARTEKNDSEYMDFSARLAGLEIQANPSQSSPCNRQLDFKRICFRSRAEISARDEIRHVIRPLGPDE